MLLPRKGILAIAAVIDVALHAQDGPVSAKALARRQGLPPRHLEPVLQALVHSNILKGVRGPSGGYLLGNEPAHITADQILGAASITDASEPQFGSNLIGEVVLPAVAQAEKAFSAALAAISIADMMRTAESLGS